MSTSEERLDALRLAASGITNMQTGQRRPTESIISDVKAYLDFISPPLPETDMPEPASLSNQTYDVIYKDGWNAAINAILDGGAGYPATATVPTGTVRNYVKALRK